MFWQGIQTGTHPHHPAGTEVRPGKPNGQHKGIRTLAGCSVAALIADGQPRGNHRRKTSVVHGSGLAARDVHRETGSPAAGRCRGTRPLDRLPPARREESLLPGHGIHARFNGPVSVDGSRASMRTGSSYTNWPAMPSCCGLEPGRGWTCRGLRGGATRPPVVELATVEVAVVADPAGAGG